MEHRLLHQARPEWPAARLRARAEHGWAVFYGDDSEAFNQPRGHGRDCGPLYRHRPHHGPAPRAPPARPEWPAGGNYAAFQVRSELTPHERACAPRRAQCAADIDAPEPPWRRGLRGDDPARNPFRASQQLANERRLAEARVREPSPRRRARFSARRGRRRAAAQRAQPEPSLYARSLRPKPEVYEWPRDFCDFPPDRG
jgi:hypothetical protein